MNYLFFLLKVPLLFFPRKPFVLDVLRVKPLLSFYTNVYVAKKATVLAI